VNRGDVTDEFIKDFGSRWILQQTQTRHQRASWIEAARGGSYFWGLTWVSGRACFGVPTNVLPLREDNALMGLPAQPPGPMIELHKLRLD
jgi:hypothetical protein